MSEYMNCSIDISARLFRDVQLRESMIGAECVVADYAILDRVNMLDRSVCDRGVFAIKTKIGFGSHLGMNSVVKNTEIGNYSSIAWNTSIGGSNHDYEKGSTLTAPRLNKLFGTSILDDRSKPMCCIGSDVWIGAGANVITGVSIGNGAVIGAGSVVVKNIEPFAVAVGNPARVIKYRFNEDVRSELLDLAWWNWDPEKLRKAAPLLHSHLTNEILEKLKKL